MAVSSLNLRGVSVSCQCACSEQVEPLAGNNAPGGAMSCPPGGALQDALGPESPGKVVSQLPAAIGNEATEQVVQVESPTTKTRMPRPERGMKHYIAELDRPLSGAPVRIGQVWHLQQEDAKSLEAATLTLYPNGFEVRPDKPNLPLVTVSWSPFSLVQACRLHSVQADAQLPWLRLFKVSVFHHGSAHYFAARDEDPEATMRARWVADVARALRQLTTSLFPRFRITADPVPGVSCTSTRLVAGYLLMCDNQDVALVYCELHAHWDNAAAFSVYEDESCEARVLHTTMAVHTCISERVGVDCSCFSVDGHHFTARTCAEKAFWLRAVSNVKVKLRHRAENPTPMELAYYRTSVADSAKSIREPELAEQPLLSLRNKNSKYGLGGRRTGAFAGSKSKSSTRSSEKANQSDHSGQSRDTNSTLATTGSQKTTETVKGPQKGKTGGPGKLFSLGTFAVKMTAAPSVARESSVGASRPDMLPDPPQDFGNNNAAAKSPRSGDAGDGSIEKSPAKEAKPASGYPLADYAPSPQSADWGN